MSFSLHSSTENFGGGRRSSSIGVELELELQRLGEVLDRDDVAERFGEPSLRNHSKLSRWMAIRSGSSSGSARLANE